MGGDVARGNFRFVSHQINLGFREKKKENSQLKKK